MQESEAATYSICRRVLAALCVFVYLFYRQTVIAPEFGQPLVIRFRPAVMLEGFADGVHLRQYPGKADIIPSTMNAATARTGNRSGILLSVCDIVPGVSLGALIGVFSVCIYAIHNYAMLNIGLTLAVYEGVTYFI